MADLHVTGNLQVDGDSFLDGGAVHVDTLTATDITASTGVFSGPVESPTAPVDTNSAQLASTAFVIGQLSASGDGTPIMDGTAARGSSTHGARANHVHPSDTSRLAAASNLSDLASASAARSSLGLGTIATQNGTFSGTSSGSNTGDQDLSALAPKASPALTGSPTAPTAAVDTNTTQIATTAMVLAQAASATPLVAGTAAVGASTRYARADHVHPAPAWVGFTPSLAAGWTAGTFVNCKYCVHGKTLTVNFKITGATISGSPSSLSFTIPNSFTSAGEMGCAVTVSDNGTVGSGWAATSSAGGTNISVFKNILASVAFANATANTAIQFSITFEIQ